MRRSASTASCRRKTCRRWQTRGPLASDAALTEEIIREADATAEPFFFFAVTLQSHGPYEPNRYPDTTLHGRSPVSELGARLDPDLSPRAPPTPTAAWRG